MSGLDLSPDEVEVIVRQLLGKPRPRRGRSIRYRRFGSLEIDPYRGGDFYDHDVHLGGDLLDLVVHVDKAGAREEAARLVMNLLRLVESGGPNPGSRRKVGEASVHHLRLVAIDGRPTTDV